MLEQYPIKRKRWIGITRFKKIKQLEHDRLIRSVRSDQTVL